MLGSCCDRPADTALLNASNLTWTPTGSGKFDVYDEEGLTFLPGGKVLDVDAYVFTTSRTVRTTNFRSGYRPWTSRGSTPVQLWDSATVAAAPAWPPMKRARDVLMPNGTVFATGANGAAPATLRSTHVSSGSWAAGPDFPSNLDIADGPAALETNGNVLMMTSPGSLAPAFGLLRVGRHQPNPGRRPA